MWALNTWYNYCNSAPTSQSQCSRPSIQLGSAHPQSVPVLVPYPREILILWLQRQITHY